MFLKIAKEEDIETSVSLLKKFYNDGPDLYRQFPFSEDRVRKMVTEGAKEHFNQIAILGIEDGKPIGIIVGILTPMMYSDKQIANEVAWYIEPEYRDGYRAVQLMEAYLHWAEHVAQADCVTIGNVKEKGKNFFKRRGFELAEQVYMKGFE